MLSNKSIAISVVRYNVWLGDLAMLNLRSLGSREKIRN